MEKLRAFWARISDSLWFVPAILTIAGGALALLLIRYNDDLVGGADAAELWWLFGGSADGARSVLESISGSIITVTGVVFSVTIIALQLASSQFTPRVLRQFMANRSNQLVLGVFIGTFTFVLLVQRTVNGGEVGPQFIPELAVTVALLLALTSIGFLIFFIDHAARSVQVATIIENVTQDTIAAVRNVFPDTLRPDSTAVERLTPGAALEEAVPPDVTDAVFVVADRAGYLQAIARSKLVKLAREHRVRARMEIEIGDYVLPGQPVLTAWPASRVSDELRSAFSDTLVLGFERTPHQDVKHGIIELMDIAVKAMSPSINDPTTCVNAIQRLGEILLEVAWRDGGEAFDRDDDGRVRTVLLRPTLEDMTNLAFNQVRHYAAENASVVVALVETLSVLVSLSPQASREPFRRHMAAVLRTASQRIKDETDIRRVEQAAAAAVRRAAAPPPLRRPGA